MGMNILLHAWDTLTKRMREVEWVSGAVKVAVSDMPGQDNVTDAVRVVRPGEYETVAASQTDQVLGTTGGVGDYLEKLVCVVATAATAQVQIKDGSGSAITVLPNSPGGGVGTYIIPIDAYSTTGAWKVTTGAGVSVFATGAFAA